MDLLFLVFNVLLLLGQLSHLESEVVSFNQPHCLQQSLIFQIVEELKVAFELLPAYTVMQLLAHKVPPHESLQHNRLLMFLHPPDLGQDLEAAILTEVLLDHSDSLQLPVLFLDERPMNRAHPVI